MKGEQVLSVVTLLVCLLLAHWWLGSENAQPPESVREENLTPHLHREDKILHSEIDTLLRAYVERHGNHTGGITHSWDDLCHRKYLVATYACPLQIGNRVHEFLNAFAVAVVSDRTLLWQYCTRPYCKSPQSRCSRTLRRQPWMLSYDKVMDLMDSHGCPVSAVNATMSAMAAAGARPIKKHEGTVEDEYSSMLVHPKNKTSSERVLACCGLHSLVGRVVHLGPLERHEAIVLALQGAVLDRHAKQRADVLFGAGEFAAYGNLLRRAFRFSDGLIKLNLNPARIAGDPKAAQQVMQGRRQRTSWSLSQKEPEPMEVRIGIHLRHVSHKDSGKEDHGETACLTKLVNELPAGSKCVVLLASDREMALHRTANVAKRLGCETRVAKRPSLTKIDRGEQKVRDSLSPQSSDQLGVWATSDVAMADVQLLGTSHFFIGSSDTWGLNMLSTYSMVIAALVASRRQNEQPDAFDEWYAAQAAKKKKWLTDVGADGPSPKMLGPGIRPHPVLNVSAPERNLDDGFGDGLFPFWLFLDSPNSPAPKKLTSWQTSRRYVDAQADNLLWLPTCGASMASYLRRPDSPSWKYTNPVFDWECNKTVSFAGTKGLFMDFSRGFGQDWSPGQCPNKATPDANDLERAQRSYEAGVQALADRAEVRRRKQNPSHRRPNPNHKPPPLNASTLHKEYLNSTTYITNKASQTAMQKRRDKMRARLKKHKEAEDEMKKHQNYDVYRPAVTGRGFHGGH